MFEQTPERGAPSRLQLATCRSARALSDGVRDIPIVRKEGGASIPQAGGDARGRLFNDRITRKDRMFSRIAPRRLAMQTIIH